MLWVCEALSIPSVRIEKRPWDIRRYDFTFSLVLGAECRIRRLAGRYAVLAQAEGGEGQVFYTLARGGEVYRRYLVVAAVLVSAAIVGGLILRWIRRS